MTFKITAAEKRALLKRRKARAANWDPGDPDSLLDPFTKEDLITAVISNEKKRDKATIKRVFEEEIRTVVKNARYTLKHSINEIEADIAKRTSTF